MWSVTCAKTQLFTVFLYIGKQKPLQIARFLKFTGPKTALFTSIYLIFAMFFMLREAETTANSDVFELAVARNIAIYSVFERPIKKHCYLRRFAKPSSLGTYKNTVKINVSSAQQNGKNHPPKSL